MPPLPGSDSVGEEARARLDDVIHSPVRLSVVAALAATDEAEFAAVRDAVQISDSALSKAVTALEQAEYVHVRKGYVGKRPRTWLKLDARPAATPCASTWRRCGRSRAPERANGPVRRRTGPFDDALRSARRPSTPTAPASRTWPARRACTWGAAAPSRPCGPRAPRR